MSKCTTKVALRGMFVASLAVGMLVAVANDSFASGSGIFEPGTDEPRMATYDNAGETHFALSITPKAESSSRSSDVVIYIDTSASQTGAFKRDSIEAVKQLLKGLNAEDRVQIVAIDLDPVPLTQGFVSPASDEVLVAMENLNQRVSLGSTDMEAMLSAAAKAFANTTDRNRNVVYVGDGVSRGSVLHSDLLAKLVTDLADNYVSVSSLAIGPDRNIELLAALANNTGGNLYIDTDDENSIQQSAIGLSQTVHGSVFWPSDGKMDDSVVDVYPKTFPPLRSDRDTVVLGTLSDREAVALRMTGLMNGQKLDMSWSINPEASDNEFAFLPGMVRDARKDRGLTLPTLGSVGLREFARARAVEANRLSDLGGSALATGNKEAARKLANAAMNLSANPANTRADLLAMATTYKVQESDNPFDTPPATAAAPQEAPAPAEDIFGAAAPAPTAVEPGAIPETPVEVTPLVEQKTVQPPTIAPTIVEPGQEQPGQVVEPPMPAEINRGNGITLIAPQDDEAEVNRLLRSVDNQSTEMLLNESDRIRVINQKVRQQVQFESTRAREELRTNPDIAIERLKNMLEVIDQTPDLYPSTRADLRHSIESSLLSARQKKLDFDDAQALRDYNVSTADELVMRADRIARHEEQVSRLVNQFNSLMEEGNYEAAVDVTQRAYEIAEHDPATVTPKETARVARNYRMQTELRRLKATKFLDSLYQVEYSTIPFPGDPALSFPDADEWRRKRIRREKYQNQRLVGSETEEKILLALDQPADLNYDEQPWNEIEEELEKKYGINIVLTTSASDDSLSEDEPVTENLTGIRLKNALRIMLEKKNATFVVKDEVLKIISLDDAEDVKWFVTNVYNVGDLVAPRTNPGGGLGGAGGFGGGQQGGGFGNQGGRGGGVFCVQESQVSLKLGSDVTPAKPIDKPKAIELGDFANAEIAWNEYFSNTFADPADVRATVRKLMNQQKTDEVVSVILAAIKHDQFQSWMHEALVLSMQIAGQPRSEIERAMMSAIDLSTDENDALYAAQYMAENGMEKRAIRILKSYARNNPTRTEPFVVGLRAAQKINDLDGIKWATTGVFSQEWPDHPEIVKQAKYAADAVKSSLAKAGRTDELAAFQADLQSALERDCYINVSWTGDADLDLFVVEPGGTTCSRLAKRTSSGGVLLRDNFTPKPGLSGQVSEQYVLPKGFAGDYRLVIKRIWGEVTSGKVTVAIHNHYRSAAEASLTKQVKIDDVGAMVLFSLDRGRRTEPLEDHEIQTVVRRQMIVNRNVLAQQISDSYSSGAASDYFGGLLGDVGGGQIGNLLGRQLAGNGVVGYTPVITQIPEGTFFTVNHATTADRLHVLVSVSPNFTQIASVSTFNILGNAETAQGIAQMAGQGGQGGGQGGGGGNVGF